MGESGPDWGSRCDNLFEEEMEMSGKIDPEAMEPSTQQVGNFEDRNVVETELGESGGLIPSPDGSESRVTPEGAAVSPNTGLKY